MQSGREFSRFQASRFTARELGLQSPHSAEERRYRHVLVSTSLNVADREALLLGFELASLHQSTLTLLQVLPSPKQDDMAYGLDAIGLLHAAADDFWKSSAAGQLRNPARPSHRKFAVDLRKFVKKTVPQRLLDAVTWRAECRQGDVAETTVKYVNESAADLVILPAKPLRWWLPIGPFAVWTIQRRAKANVMVIRSQAPSRRP